jgi:hypothetical protein
VRLVDTKRDVDRGEIRIWMNNPLRYSGETFYQSGYFRDPRTGIEQTTLQVVTNTGWMIPYVACMLVATGMFAHFWNTLLRFLQRQSRVTEPPAPLVIADLSGETSPAAGDSGSTRRKKGKQIQPERRSGLADAGLDRSGDRRLDRRWLGGRQDGAAANRVGRVQLGRVRRTAGRFRGTSQTDGYAGSERLAEDLGLRDVPRRSRAETHSAVEWFLDVVARPDRADEHRVFRIYNLEVLQLLGLERRKGFHYSLAEIRGEPGEVRKELAEFDRQGEQARKLDSEDLDFFQRKLLEVDNRFRSYTLIASAFQPLEFPPLPTEEEFEQDREAATERIMRIRQLMRCSLGNREHAEANACAAGSATNDSIGRRRRCRLGKRTLGGLRGGGEQGISPQTSSQ